VSDYSGIRLELGQTPPAGALSAKFYGATTSGTQAITAANTLIKLPSNYGTTLQRVTLQYNRSTSYSTTIKRMALVRKDGTETEVNPTVFWGCTLTVDSKLKPSGIIQTTANTQQADNRIYTLTGQQLSATPRRGIYIRNGRKLLVK
jgi:hypothetical protein